MYNVAASHVFYVITADLVIKTLYLHKIYLG